MNITISMTNALLGNWQGRQMVAQSSEHGLSSRIGTTMKARHEGGGIKLISENDAPSAALSQKWFAGSERRLLIRLENYWRTLRHSSGGPFFADFRPSRNPVPWRNCFIAYVCGGIADLTFDHVGGSIIALFKPDRTNVPDREWLLNTIATRFGEITDVLKTGRPARREDRLYRPEGLATVYRSVVLPFVDGKRRPAYVVGALTYHLGPMPTA